MLLIRDLVDFLIGRKQKNFSKWGKRLILGISIKFNEMPVSSCNISYLKPFAFQKSDHSNPIIFLPDFIG